MMAVMAGYLDVQRPVKLMNNSVFILSPPKIMSCFITLIKNCILMGK